LKVIQRGLLVAESRFLAIRLGLTILTDQRAALKDWSAQRAGRRPRVRCAGRESGKFTADLAKESREANLRKELRHTDSDLCIRGAQALLRLTDVRPAFEQRAGQPGGNFRRHDLFIEFRGMGDRARVLSK